MTFNPPYYSPYPITNPHSTIFSPYFNHLMSSTSFNNLVWKYISRSPYTSQYFPNEDSVPSEHISDPNPFTMQLQLHRPHGSLRRQKLRCANIVQLCYRPFMYYIPFHCLFCTLYYPVHLNLFHAMLLFPRLRPDSYPVRSWKLLKYHILPRFFYIKLFPSLPSIHETISKFHLPIHDPVLGALVVSSSLTFFLYIF